ncbi:MAG TPA: hypothetical protein VMM79_18770 [Longimicrobiales bacterium]|nr:hypothetical protein [Longimicrobiales bacterium]
MMQATGWKLRCRRARRPSTPGRVARWKIIPALCAAIAVPAVASAQVRAAGTLDSASISAIDRIVAEAGGAGLPIEPLRNKVAEGISKGADGELIVRAVDRLRQRLGRAAAALGEAATTPDLVAAAALLDLGITDTHLRHIRAARPGQPVASALVGLAFLVQRGAGTDGAVGIVVDMLNARVSDAEFDRFRETVSRDVQAGASVTGAARARASAAIQRRGGFVPGGDT